MNKTVMKGKWHQTKGAMKEQWGRLTDDDVTMFIGEGEQLVGRLQERYGYTKHQAEKEVEGFLKDLNAALPFGKRKNFMRRHPAFTGVMVSGVILLVIGYVLNHFYSFIEVEKVTSPAETNQ